MCNLFKQFVIWDEWYSDLRLNLKKMASTNDKDQISIAAQGCCAFASDLHKVIIKIVNPPRGNTVYSPLSIHAFVTFLLQGTDGPTAEEIETCLRLTNTERLNSDYKDLLISITGPSSEVRRKGRQSFPMIHLVNALFVSEDLQLEDSFGTTGSDSYDVAVHKVHYGSGWSPKFINTWISTITEGDVRPGMQLGMVSSIIFECGWDKKVLFWCGGTKDYVFHVNKNLRKKVATMSQTNNYNHGVIPSMESTFLEIPYAEPYDMIIILPNEMDGLGFVEKNFDWNAVINAKRSVVPINLRLPKFRIMEQYNLHYILPSLGMKSMFRSSRDFDRMIHEIDESQRKFQPRAINFFIHKVVLDVDEWGTGINGYSYCWKQSPVLKEPCTQLPEPIDFFVDRPFIAAVRHIESNVPLLISSIRKIGRDE